METVKKLALFAGEGDLPRQIIQYMQEIKQDLFVIAFQGQTDPNLVQSLPHAWVKFGQLRLIFQILSENNVDTVVMAGSMRRPSWSEIKPDWEAAQWIAKIGLKSLGDDGLLSALVDLLKSRGLRVIAPSDILQNLMAPKGILGQNRPSDQDQGDIQRGAKVLQALGQQDVGQAIVVQEGLVLGIEAIEGTQALLKRCLSLKRQGSGGVLVKLAKPQQSEIVDMPTIGVDTVQQAQACGLNGIAIEAGRTQVLQPTAVIQAADQAGIFLIGIDAQARIYSY